MNRCHSEYRRNYEAKMSLSLDKSNVMLDLVEKNPDGKLRIGARP